MCVICDFKLPSLHQLYFRSSLKPKQTQTHVLGCQGIQKRPPKHIDKDRPGCSAGDNCQGTRLRVAGHARYITQESPPPTHDHMCTISLHHEVPLGSLLSRTNLDWHYVSEDLSRPVNKLHSEAAGHAKRISSLHAGLSTPTASKTPISNTILTSLVGAMLVDDYLRLDS